MSIANWRKQIRFALSAIIFGAALSGVQLSAQASPSPNEIHVNVEITSVTLTGEQPEDTVTIVAKVTNDSKLPAFGVQAVLWRSTNPIYELQALKNAVANNNTNWGSRMGGNGPHYHLITSSIDQYLPGVTQEVTLSATLAALGIAGNPGVFPVGVQVFGTPDASSNYKVIGQTNTFVSLAGEAKIPITNLILLTAAPTKLSDSLFANEDLAAQLKPEGKLSGLLATIGPNDGYIVDPALIDEIVDMADGYQVQTTTGQKEGTGIALAADWLASFDRLSATGVRSIFANPDLGNEQADKILESALSTPLGQVAELPLVVIPPRFAASAKLLKMIDSAAPKAVLASNLRDVGALQISGELPVLAVTQLDTRPAVWAKQYQLAETLVAGSKGQLRLISKPEDAQRWGEITAPWMETKPFSDLLEPASFYDPAYFNKTKTPSLDDTELTRVTNISKDIDNFAELVTQTSFIDEEAALVTRAASSVWIEDADGQKKYLSALSELIGKKALSDAVEIKVTPNFVMSSQANVFPITVKNKTAHTISIKIVTRSLNPQRLTVPDTEVVQIGPGVSQTFEVYPRATSNGVIQVLSHVTTKDGLRVSSDVRITISVTNMSLIGWIIVIVSGALVFILTAARIWKKRKDLELPKSTNANPNLADPNLANPNLAEPKPTSTAPTTPLSAKQADFASNLAELVDPTPTQPNSPLPKLTEPTNLESNLIEPTTHISGASHERNE